MALDLTRMQKLATPVTSYYKGRAMRQAEKLGEQEYALGEQQRRINEIKLAQAEQPQAPDPQDVQRVQDLVSERQQRTLKAYEAIREKAGPEEAEEYAQMRTQQDYKWLRENYPWYPVQGKPEWDYDAVKAFFEEEPDSEGLFSKVDPSKYTRESISQFEETGVYADLVPRQDDDTDQRTQRIAAVRGQLERGGLASREASDMAVNIVDGNVRMELTDTGQVRLIDEVNQTAKEIPLAALQEEIPEPEQGRTLWDLAPLATGPESAAAAGISRIPGVPVAEQVVQARQRFRLAQQNLLSTLRSTGSRPLAIEMEQLFNSMQLDPALIDQPEALRARLVALNEELGLRISQAERDSRDPGVPDETREAQGAAASAMRNFVATMGVPEGMTNTGLSDEEQAELERLRQLQGAGNAAAQ